MDSTARKPVFESLEHVSAGWINKYVLTYRMPDGRTHVYESASRKKRDDYERELRAMDELAIKREGAAENASDKESVSVDTEEEALEAFAAPADILRSDAISIVGRTETTKSCSLKSSGIR